MPRVGARAIFLLAFGVTKPPGVHTICYLIIDNTQNFNYDKHQYVGFYWSD